MRSYVRLEVVVNILQDAHNVLFLLHQGVGDVEVVNSYLHCTLCVYSCAVCVQCFTLHFSD